MGQLQLFLPTQASSQLPPVQPDPHFEMRPELPELREKPAIDLHRMLSRVHPLIHELLLRLVRLWMVRFSESKVRKVRSQLQNL